MIKKNIPGGLRIKLTGKAGRNEFVRSLAKTLISLYDDFGIDEISGINMYMQLHKNGEKKTVTDRHGNLVNTIELSADTGCSDFLSTGLSAISLTDIKEAEHSGRNIKEYISLRYLNDIKHKRPDLFVEERGNFIKARASIAEESKISKEVISENSRDFCLAAIDEHSYKEKIKQEINADFNSEDSLVISFSKIKTKMGMSLYIKESAMPEDGFIYNVLIKDRFNSHISLRRFYSDKGVRIQTISTDEQEYNDKNQYSIDSQYEPWPDAALYPSTEENTDELEPRLEQPCFKLEQETLAPAPISSISSYTSHDTSKCKMARIVEQEMSSKNIVAMVLSVSKIKTKSYMRKYIPVTSIPKTGFIYRVSVIQSPNNNGTSLLKSPSIKTDMFYNKYFRKLKSLK